MPERSRRRPRDPNQLAKAIVDIATGQAKDRELSAEEQGKNPAAVALGRLGGLKGGKASQSHPGEGGQSMIADEEGAAIATFRKVSPLDYVRGPKKERSPEEEAEEAARRIIKEVNKLRREREKKNASEK